MRTGAPNCTQIICYTILVRSPNQSQQCAGNRYNKYRTSAINFKPFIHPQLFWLRISQPVQTPGAPTYSFAVFGITALNMRAIIVYLIMQLCHVTFDTLSPCLYNRFTIYTPFSFAIYRLLPLPFCAHNLAIIYAE